MCSVTVLLFNFRGLHRCTFLCFKVVHGTFDVTKTDELWEAADGQHADLDGSSQQKKTFGYGARVVVIGRYLDRRKLERGLKATVMTTAAGLQN